MTLIVNSRTSDSFFITRPTKRRSHVACHLFIPQVNVTFYILNVEITFKNTNERLKSVCAEDVQQSTHPALTFPREIYVATQTGSGIAKKKREREGESLQPFIIFTAVHRLRPENPHL